MALHIDPAAIALVTDLAKSVKGSLEEAQTGLEKKVLGKVEADHAPKSNTR